MTNKQNQKKSESGPILFTPLYINNIVSFFNSREKLWICMEYCGGGSLQDIYHGMFIIKILSKCFLKLCTWKIKLCQCVFSDRTSVRASNSICLQRDLTGNCTFWNYCNNNLNVCMFDLIATYLKYSAFTGTGISTQQGQDAPGHQGVMYFLVFIFFCLLFVLISLNTQLLTFINHQTI